MAERLADKIALITGAGSGLGREMALLFADHGARVVVNDIDEETGRQTASDVDGLFVAGDVADQAAVRALVAAVADTHGRLDVSVHNAGVMYPDDGGLDTSLDVWHRVIAINLTGVFLCSRHAVPLMLAGGGGSLINIASFVALMGAASPQIAYSASKGGVLSMTREIATIHARDGLRANALCPGPIRTPLLEHLIADEASRANRLNHIPLNRFGEPRDVAQAALYLASDDSGWVTGTAFTVDGGITSAYLTEP